VSKKECPRCLFTEDIARINDQCEYCDIHDSLERQSPPSGLSKLIQKIAIKKGKYNCLIGISGGLDSSALLYAAVRWWNLRPLVIHFDNNWNSEVAKANMHNLCFRLNVDSIIYKVNREEYNLLNDCFLKAGVPDADIPNDIAMTKLMYETADKYRIKYILNGHDFREEGSTPRDWTYMDAKYIRSVYKSFTGLNLKNYPLFTFKDQIIYSLKGIKQVRPFHFMTDRSGLENAMISFCGWHSYGGKHAENIYTEYVGAKLLPEKFNIDKRIVYLSARVRSGKISKSEAREILSEKPEFYVEKLSINGRNPVDITSLARCKIVPRDNYDRYNFKRLRPIIWIMAKMKIVPWTFFYKYSK
jgi:hypothetical protein